MSHTFETTVWVESLGVELEIVEEVEISRENNGIGSYEYWGAKGFDAGNDYAELESFELESIREVETDFEFAESKEIRDAVEKALTDDVLQGFMEREIESDAGDEADRRADDRRDDF